MPCCTTDAQIPCPISLYITGPSQCPQVDKPHLASIAGTLSAVAGHAWEEVAQVVWNCSHVTDRYNRRFPQDTLYWHDLHNQFPVVQQRLQLVKNQKTNQFQPSWTAILIKSIISISSYENYKRGYKQKQRLQKRRLQPATPT